MAKIKSDNPLELELDRVKTRIRSLDILLKQILVGFHLMPPKERARILAQFETEYGAIQSFFLRVTPGSFTMAGPKFSYDSVKLSFESIQTRWRNFQKTL